MDHADTSPDDAELPLRGLRVVVTRPRGQVEEFARRLSRLGADPVACPTIHIVPPEDPSPLREAASAVGSYDWVVLTSVNGAERLADALEEEGVSRDALTGARVAAIGPSTADRARERLGVEVDVVPEEYRA
jgi:uroporphyrinogen III methyltransferase/synthase